MMKQIIDQLLEWLHAIKDEISPFGMSALAALSLILILFSPERLTLVVFLRIAVICVFVAGASYWTAIHYGFTHPQFAAIGGGFFVTPFVLSISKLSWEFVKTPKSLLNAISRLKK